MAKMLTKLAQAAIVTLFTSISFSSFANENADVVEVRFF